MYISIRPLYQFKPVSLAIPAKGIQGTAQLSAIDAKLKESGFPDDISAIEKLLPVEKRQYYAYLSAQRIRIENVLYQQTLGVVHEPQTLVEAKKRLTNLQAFGLDENNGRLQELMLEVEKQPTE